jgi:polyvinyl alcohol dehydrogenase (cytochrome)
VVWGAVVVALLSASSVFAQTPPAQVRASEGDGSTIFGNNCENCHGKLETAPTPAMLKQMTPERIYAALTTGDMKTQAQSSGLTDKQLRDIAEWVGGRKLATDQNDDARNMPNACSNKEPITAKEFGMPGWNGWSNDLFNHRFQPGPAAMLQAASVQRLQMKWAFALPSAASVYGQPTVVGGRVLVSGDSGYLYSLDAQTGCVHWSFKAQTGVASAPIVALKPGSRNQYLAYFGDIRGNTYAVDTANGELVWKTLVDKHPLARIRGGIKYYNGRLYVPVASLEEPESSSPNYVCCTFRGSVAALDAATGKQIWQTYTLDEKPTARKSAAGKNFMGPSGVGVWGPTMIDPKRKAIYISTGNTFSGPDVGRGDALMGLDIDTGKILWVVQDEAGDVWHTGCPQGPPPPNSGLPPRSAGRAPGPGRGALAGGGGRGARPPMPESYYCPDETSNPDWDFSAGVMLANLPNGKSLLIAAQKSGMVWAHDPDNKGALVWKSDVSRGQVVFGGAMDDDTAYFGMRGGAIVAVRLSDGLEKWSTIVPPQESMSTHGGISAAVTLIPGVLFAPGLDGMLRAFSTFDGRQIWGYDTTKEVKTVNGLTARGGSIGSAGATVANGMVFVTSGYTGFQGGQPGNLLLAFGPPAN